MEHVESPDTAIREWKDRINPVFVRFSCNVNQTVPTLIERGGFGIEHLSAAYVSGTERFPKFLKALSFEYLGAARAR